ncbi:hypothetical protein [Streptomyces vinaceus]|uniref:hypothetical protein n=1 Tax=Streptomyces vinaceus TaxID=1960 RepID=UPI00380DAA36
MNPRLPSTKPRTHSLIRRMAQAHRNRQPAAQTPAGLAAGIAEDRESLRELMTPLDVTEQWPGVAEGQRAEKAARLKPDGRLVRRSPLSDVPELEAMRLGVEGKAALWRALRTRAVTDSRLDLRVRAARRTFTTTTTVGALDRPVRSRRSSQERAGWAS